MILVCIGLKTKMATIGIDKETQALLIEAFAEIEKDKKYVR